MSTVEKLRERLRARMASKGWRRIDIARRAGLPPSTITRFLDGETSPLAETCEKIQHAIR